MKTQTMKSISYQLENLTCPSCITKIEGILNKTDGVDRAKVLFNSSKVKVAYDEDKTSAEHLAKLIEKLGYPVLSY